jgi:hypothetical protein
MPDGVTLLADLYRPRGAEEMPTVLVRTPYGRRGPLATVNSRLLAERGLQVLLQSCRGTFGSGGELEPFRERTTDSQHWPGSVSSPGTAVPWEPPEPATWGSHSGLSLPRPAPT